MNVHSDTGDPETSARVQQAARQISPPIAPGRRLAEEERLKIENIFLKIQNLQLQVQNLDAAKAGMIDQMRQLQQEMDEYRRALSQKYGTDISRTNVTADGVILDPEQPLPAL